MSATLIVPRDIAARMLDQACATCRYSWKDQKDLNCRRNPPTAFLVFAPTGPHVTTAHPVVAPDSWCGCWEQRGNATTG
jgi:hypothetical protein